MYEQFWYLNGKNIIIIISSIRKEFLLQVLVILVIDFDYAVSNDTTDFG